MLTDQLEIINGLLKELEITIEEVDIEKSQEIISNFNQAVQCVLRDDGQLQECDFKSIQSSLNRFGDLISNVAERKKNTGNELGAIINVKKKLKAYKNAK
ncbi:hypothetical protein O1D97_05955 [Marinomonas sp. 15G1-11]|uniref:Uncharacterized protein n=1 Tax=Marinomonas phaeophyticola TaxID=3004091 RepID=A0ABT4JS81_9GAMM|nr:hypothetical protein [Marinomonas sp. 15G1-11]MCZ2721204.1 hypothetical protein [Marinomonas sp. 15G1-11]